VLAAEQRLACAVRKVEATASGGTTMSRTDQGPSQTAITALTAIGVMTGVVVAVLASDVILGVIVGAAFIAIAVGLLRLWTGGGTPRSQDR
jgi:hypothetical protein